MANWAVFNVAEALRVAAILLTPVMPSKSEMILDELNVDPKRRTLEWATRGADKDYGRERSHPLSTSRVQPWDSVFPPVPTASISDMEVLDVVAEQSEYSPRNKLTKMAEYMAMEARMGPDAMAELLESRKKTQTPKAGSTRNRGAM
jgi:hypothetical protein